MSSAIFGIETEFAVYPIQHGVDIAAALKRYKTRYVTINSAHGTGTVISTGGVVYIDSGKHLEHCTPECSTPKEFLAFNTIGEDLLLRVSKDIFSKQTISDPANYPVMRRCNVDYQPASEEPETWGCHENFAIIRVKKINLAIELPKLNYFLLPHLGSRIMYTGVGGLATRLAGISPVLSPRLATNKGARFFSLKDASGMAGYRVHVITGDTNQSQLANYLKMGTTSLILQLIQHGAYQEKDMEDMVALTGAKNTSLAKAARTIIKATNPMIIAENFKGSLALQVQRLLLQKIREELESEWMPSWAPELCDVWASILTDLEINVDRVTDKLEWAMKRTVIDAHLQIEDTSLKQLNDPASQHLSIVPRLRAEIGEIDIRFGELGPRGIYNQLDALNLFDDKIIDQEFIDEAATRGPYGTRAFVRSEITRKAKSNMRGNMTSHRYWGSIEINSNEPVSSIPDNIILLGKADSDKLSVAQQKLIENAYLTKKMVRPRKVK